LIYLTVTKPDITFVVGVLIRFMHQLREVHLTTALRALVEKVCCTRNVNMFVFLAILIQDMLVIREIGSPLLAIAHLLEEIW